MLVALLFAGVSLFLSQGIDQIPEGYIGVYWRGGSLLDMYSEPGIHFKVPIIDRSAHVQVTMQTDSVTDIPCGTSGGVVIFFDRIEVVNRLRKDHAVGTIRSFGVDYDKMWIFDKIHHEINQFCSSHSLREVVIEQFDTLDESLAKALQADCDKHKTGIEIITVRVTKPRIPDSVKRNYEAIEAERTALQLAAERHKVAEREAQIDATRARINAEKFKAVREIELAKEILEREAVQKMSHINDEMLLATEKAKADAAYYVALKEADANKLKLTPAFLQYVMYTSLANNSKVFYGDKLPTMFPASFPSSGGSVTLP